MPPSVFYPPLPIFASLSAVLCVVFLFLAMRERRTRQGRRAMGLNLTLAVVFAVATGGLGVASYHQYVVMNTWNYIYAFDAQPNATSPEAIIVPIPEDTSLLSGLHLVSGEANWSFTDTIHGRGLYVQFSGFTSINAVFSEFAPAGSRHNTGITMTNSSGQFGLPPVWIFYSGGGVKIHFQSGYQALSESEAIVTGWHLYPLTPLPVA